MAEIPLQTPAWLLRPLGAFAEINAPLLDEIAAVSQQLPDSLPELEAALYPALSRNDYDAAANLANAAVWPQIEPCLASKDLGLHLCRFATVHFPQPALARLIRRMIVHPRWQRHGRRLLVDSEIDEVSLAKHRWRPFDTSSWRLSRAGKKFAGSSERRQEQGVPDIVTVGELRDVLKIRSPRQLGFMLSASAEEGGAYRQFQIAKRSSESRTITAPCSSLLWVQRRILHRILDPLRVADNAHGFVRGRSTVTNAAPHLGAKLLLKFDLRDFFPTIHEYRVQGLFARMGYHVGGGRFSTDDRSHDVAPVLARLCCLSQGPGSPAILPQGAPTSPALSNLICRRLDQRLAGLAGKFSGTYTRYADDLTFSFRDEVPVGALRWWVEQVCFQEGFSVRQDKFRAIRASQRQQVTGIVVNERLNVPRRERRRFRAILHQCRRDGLAAMSDRQPGLTGYLRGFAAYVHMVDPTDERRLLGEVNALLGKDDA